MLTPRFEISQTDAELIFIIHAPYANIKEAVVHVEKNDFRFYATPYYLRLSLPGDIKETDSSKGSYDCEKGEFRLVFSKVNEGEHFENLDMITTLLAPARKRNTVPTIEVISNPCSNENEASGTQEASDDENMTPDGGDEWYIDQNIEKEKKVILQNSPRYGFANKITKALNNFEDSWIKEIIDLPQPDETSEVDRKTLKEQQERSDFSADHYTADLMEDDVVEPYLAYEWETIVASDVKFNGEEMDILKELPNKEYLLDAEEIDAALYSMVDILFAHCYNRRVTLGDNNVVSGWTINKLSSTLSWFQIFSSIDDVISSGVRRSLCYPQVRNWNLALVVLEDLKKVLKLGKMYIIKQFCEIYTLFNNSPEPRYILNQLYIKDYLIWLQQISCSKIEEMENRVKNIQVEKATMGLNLEMIEAAAYNTLNDLIIENNLDELQNGMDKLALGQVKESKNNSDSDSADSESDSSSSSGDSSSCTDSDSDSSDSDSNSDSDSESESESEISKNNEIVYSNKSHSIPKLQNSSSSELDSDDDPN